MTDMSPALDEPSPVKLTVEEFLRLTETGVFDRHAKTELLDGVIVAMNSQFSRHARVQSRLFRKVADAVDAVLPGFEALIEASVAILPDNLPEPDIVVTSFMSDARVAVPVGTVALIIEVADTTTRHDLGTKARVYAEAGVPEYWVIAIETRMIHMLWTPEGGVYRDRRDTALGAPIAAATIPAFRIDGADLL